MKQLIFGTMLLSSCAYLTIEPTVPVIRSTVNQDIPDPPPAATSSQLSTQKLEDNVDFPDLIVQGSLDVNQVKRGIRQKLNDYRTCYLSVPGLKEKLLARADNGRNGKRNSSSKASYDEGLTGETFVNFDINQDGHTENVRVSKSEVTHPGFIACIESQIRKLSFPESSGPTSVRRLVLNMTTRIDHVKE